MRLFRLILPLAAAVSVNAASYPVIDVPGPDRVVVQYFGLPISVSLAHVKVATDASTSRACQDRLIALAKGKKAEVTYLPSFGTTADGAARVQLIVDSVNVSETLVANGLAAYAPGTPVDPKYDEKIRQAEAKARAAKLGIWAAAPVVAAAPVKTAPAKPATPAPHPAGAPTGPFCSELDSAYYYPRGDAAVANVAAQRLIYYADESAAQRAGKSRKPAVAPAPPTGDVSEKSGDALFAQGKAAYSEAISKGNTSDRDSLYEKAYVILSQAMNIFAPLCEKDPDNETLAEKLRECMQLRYGSIKQRRF